MRWIALLSLLFATTSLGFAQDQPAGFESPEKAFRAYMKGTVSQDFDLMLSSLTPEAKAYHIALSVVSVSYLFDKKSQEKLFADYGIDKLGEAKTEEKDPDNAIVKTLLKVKNPAKLMRQVAERTEELAKELTVPSNPASKAKTPSQEEILASVTLTKVTITGNSAVAAATVAESARNVISPIPEKVEFRRIKGRWFCVIDPR